MESESKKIHETILPISTCQLHERGCVFLAFERVRVPLKLRASTSSTKALWEISLRTLHHCLRRERSIPCFKADAAPAACMWGCIDCFSEGLKDSGPTGIQLSQALPLCPCLASYELLVQQMRILAQQAEEFWAFF